MTGDTLLQVSGRPAVGLTLDEVAYMLRSGGSNVALTVSRPADSKAKKTPSPSAGARAMLGATTTESSTDGAGPADESGAAGGLLKRTGSYVMANRKRRDSTQSSASSDVSLDMSASAQNDLPVENPP